MAYDLPPIYPAFEFDMIAIIPPDTDINIRLILSYL